MAMPSAEKVYEYVEKGMWNAVQVRTALICKVIDQDQYDELIEKINSKSKSSK